MQAIALLTTPLALPTSSMEVRYYHWELHSFFYSYSLTGYLNGWLTSTQELPKSEFFQEHILIFKA